MLTWLTPTLFSLFSFGLWGLFSKLALVHIDSKSALIYQTLGVLIIGIITLFLLDFKLATNAKGFSYGLLTGIAYGIGCLFYLIAVGKGRMVTVVTLTALYPFVTILLSYVLLKEGINVKQGIGVVLALVAIYLLSS